MASADRLLGEPVADSIVEAVVGRLDELDANDVVPTLGTVMMADAPGPHRFMDLKHEACEELGVATRDVRLDPDAPAERAYGAVERLSADPNIDGIFVQVPLPDRVGATRIRRVLDPAKDVDCFAFENLGRLVAGDPRFLPATPAAVIELLDAYDVPTAGREAVIVGRSTVIGKPLAALLLRDGPLGNATVTVSHSRTRDLGAVTRRADIVVTAAGEPGLVDGSMLSPGAVVVDVSANRQERADGTVTVVGDVDFESAAPAVRAITPVPGGVGPVTIACLLRNVVLAAERRHSAGADAR